MDHFKNPFKSLEKSIKKTTDKAMKVVSKNTESISKSITKDLTPSSKSSSSSSSSSSGSSSQGSTSLQSENFNNDMYFSIFCNNNDYLNMDGYKFDKTGQQIISETQKGTVMECQTLCNNNKSCVGFNYKNKNVKSTDKNCMLFKTFPTKTIQDSNFQYKIRNSAKYDYNKLNSTQKKNVQKYCIQQRYNSIYPSKKFNIQSCFKDISTKGNLNYINLDAECVWNSMNDVDLGKTDSKMTLNKNKNIQNSKGSSVFDKYSNDFKSYKDNNNKYKSIERDLEKYDSDFNTYQQIVGDENTQLKNRHQETIEGTLAYSELLKINNRLTVGGDKLEKAISKGDDEMIESFENMNEVKSEPCWKEFILIFLILCLIYYLFYRK